LIQNAIYRIEDYQTQWQDRLDADSPELEFLSYWLDEIAENKPMTEVEQLSKELDKAVREENYEKAAELRDRLAELDLN